jgi:hypothetical protein
MNGTMHKIHNFMACDLSSDECPDIPPPVTAMTQSSSSSRPKQKPVHSLAQVSLAMPTKFGRHQAGLD